jgi:probable F420-dependent oxidoreductase
VSLATAAAVTARIGLGTAVALPAESDPITLAKAIATLDHLSGGRVTVGAGFGWNTDELADHGVPAGQRRAVLAEYVAAMRALWTQPEAAYDGKFVSFGPCWAFPKPVQAHLPLIIGAGGGPQTLGWIAQHADGWLTTPGEQDIGAKAALLRQAWAAASRAGTPDIRVLVSSKPSADDVAGWARAGVTECLWGLPDGPAGTAEAHLDRLAARVASWR